ncbi:transporter, major facilitator family protein [Sesbania bispinosa]|nr:transporter, major facilitator family protein [Sesbania bispinosa]
MIRLLILSATIGLKKPNFLLCETDTEAEEGETKRSLLVQWTEETFMGEARCALHRPNPSPRYRFTVALSCELHRVPISGVLQHHHHQEWSPP